MSENLKLSKKQKIIDEFETSQRNEFFHIEKKVAREILETANGVRTVHEVETSTSNNNSFTQSQISRHKEVARQTLEHLNIKEPSQLVNHSHIARQRIRDIEDERSAFYKRYPGFTIVPNNPQKEDKEQFTEALQTYFAAAFVDFTWAEIMEADGAFRRIDFERILVNKLIWNALSGPLVSESPSVERIVNDKSASISLVTFDMYEHTANVLLSIPCADNFKLTIKLKDVDPFLLMLIPDAESQIRVRNFTRSLANDVINE